MKRMMKTSNLNNSKGFTLLEALLGFLILSIGMLGVASLQTLSLKAGKSSVYGSVAMMKVEEILEHMRANPTGLPTYVTAGTGLNNGCTGGTVTCNADALASEDLFWWNQNLVAGLPGVVGIDIITNIELVPAVAPSQMATVIVSVSWNERRKDSAGSEMKSYEAATDICTTIPC